MNHLLTSNAYLHYLKYIGIGCTLMCAVPIFASPEPADVTSVAIVQQQEERIEGTILDENGEPIIGANVVVKGSSNGTITDFEGNFQFNANKGDIIVISFGGSKAGIEAVKDGKLKCNL